MPAYSKLLKTYRALGHLLGSPLQLLYARRVKRGKEDPARKHERFGKPQHGRPDGPLVWVHAASVGETNAVLPLIKSLVAQDVNVLLTTGTLTSYSYFQRAKLDGVIHQFVPYDIAPALQPFLDHWQPQVAITVESEIWPATFSELKQRGIPLAIVNGRMSPRSFANWSRIGNMAKSTFAAAHLVVAQTPEDAERFARLGAQLTVVSGNIKFDGAVLEADQNDLLQLTQVTAKRPLWLAASTHPGEEEVVIAAHKALKQAHPNLLTILVPRHPERGEKIAAMIKEAGLQCMRRSLEQQPEAACDVYLADTLGELGLFYALAPIVFLGGSLMPIGGHNILEPAQLDCAVLSGPYTDNFQRIFAQFVGAGGAEIVADEQELVSHLKALFTSDEKVGQMATAAGEIARSGRGALARTQAALLPLINSHCHETTTNGGGNADKTP
ncbi:3-deoxy-D-manno-octulosonic acid transferase [Polycladidibacter hongkongensis]|uniref:3-deoxy-D-manno-octulosonic acid transferase n=1 Tax=Polycladidibacter hongkongensis TaxID=1647556 RepID=UPI0009EB8D2D|nr:3-deoxy-D-manno-octulosonic acid transferase [Pseudovibrio hongkongensis]